MQLVARLSSLPSRNSNSTYSSLMSTGKRDDGDGIYSFVLHPPLCLLIKPMSFLLSSSTGLDPFQINVPS